MLPSNPRRERVGAFDLFQRTALTAALLAGLAAAAQAQTAAVPNTSADSAASERAKREGDKVFQWIRIHSDKPRKAAAAPVAAEKPIAAAAPPAVKVVAKTAAKPTETGITETARPLSTAAGRSDSPPAPSRTSQPLPEPVTQQVAAKTDASAPLVASSATSPQVEIEEDVPLTPTFRSEPEFPGALMRTLRKGLVQVAFTVKPDGTVSEVHAVSSTHPRLASSAVATVEQWKFKPVRHAQQAIVDLGFNLD